VVGVGDLNEGPDVTGSQAPNLARLSKNNSPLIDCYSLPGFDVGNRPGTFDSCVLRNRFDYIFILKSLQPYHTGGRVFRKRIVGQPCKTSHSLGDISRDNSFRGGSLGSFSGRDRIKYLIRIEKFSRLLLKPNRLAARRHADAASRYRLLFANSVRRARERDRRQVFGYKRARPPAALTWFRETVAIPICANKFWRRVREWVVCKQPKDSLFVFEHSLHEREEPQVQVRRRHGSEPHLPVELPMIWRDDAWRTVHVAGFSLELVFAPFR